MTETLALFHRVGANALLIFSVVLAVWGTYQYFRHSAVSGGFRSSYLIMAGLSAVQGLVGLAAFAFGARPSGQLLHFVYGIFAVLFLPGAYVYARSGIARREALILAGAAWIVGVAFFRGIATG